jgi:hypothetical protein
MVAFYFCDSSRDLAMIFNLTLLLLAFTMKRHNKSDGGREEILGQAKASAKNTEGANPGKANPGETLR